MVTLALRELVLRALNRVEVQLRGLDLGGGFGNDPSSGEGGMGGFVTPNVGMSGLSLGGDLGDCEFEFGSSCHRCFSAGDGG